MHARIQIYWCRSSIFRHLKLELLTQFPASNDEKYINVVYIWQQFVSFYGYVHWRMTTEISVMYGSEKVKPHWLRISCLFGKYPSSVQSNTVCGMHLREPLINGNNNGWQTNPVAFQRVCRGIELLDELNWGRHDGKDNTASAMKPEGEVPLISCYINIWSPSVPYLTMSGDLSHEGGSNMAPLFLTQRRSCLALIECRTATHDEEPQ